MWAFVQRLCSSRWLPVSWTIFTIILLCIPGSDLPGTGVFSIEGLDKVAHVSLFGGIVLFWGFFFRQNPAKGQLGRKLLWAVLLTTLLGIGLEFLQRYAIPFRSFDVWDIVADFGGAIAAWLFHTYWLSNKRSVN